MRVKRLFAFLIFFLTILTPLQAQPSLLGPGDVRKVMAQLFEYHIDKKEISPLILTRSLKIYLNNFDPNHAYLLSEEATSYLQPSDRLLKTMLSDYQRDQFTAYFSLNATIQKSIMRARSWRKEWEENPKKLVQDAKEVTLQTLSDRPFSNQANELKQRHYQQLLHLIAFQYKQLAPGAIDGKEERLVSLCEKQLCLLENAYLGADDQGKTLSTKECEHLVILRTLKSLAHSLDAHTAYYSPDEAFAMKVQLEKGMCGIGVVLHEGIEGVVIADVIKGGPAEKTGSLKVGDTIVEVDGASVRDYSFHKVLDVLRGGEGTKTTLGVMRNRNKEHEFLRVELVRTKMTLDDKRVDVSSEPFGDGIIGKITLYSFYEGDDGISSEKDIRKAITELRAKAPLYGLVLDMRENSGGFLSQAVRVSGLFISSGVVVVSKYSDGNLKYYRTVDGNKFYDGPLTVLISRGSASATEIVAQTLQDYGVALVVGDAQTYGKGTIQHQTVTSDSTNSFFKVTIGRYYTVSGKSTQIEGVKSDILVPTEYNFEKVGESYLDFPLPADQIEAAYQDPLTDIDFYARKWFVKYYVPSLQPREMHLKEVADVLRENSRQRVAANKNFQHFLKKIRNEKKPSEAGQFGSNDLQLEEAVNIVKDMIYLQQRPSSSAAFSAVKSSKEGSIVSDQEESSPADALYESLSQ